MKRMSAARREELEEFVDYVGGHKQKVLRSLKWLDRLFAEDIREAKREKDKQYESDSKKDKKQVEKLMRLVKQDQYKVAWYWLQGIRRTTFAEMLYDSLYK